MIRAPQEEGAAIGMAPGSRASSNYSRALRQSSATLRIYASRRASARRLATFNYSSSVTLRLMPPRRQLSEVHHLAALGARVRVEQIEREIARLYVLFPALRRTRGKGTTGDPQVAAAKRPARRNRMSDEARQAARERMQRYWAAKRGTAASGGNSAAENAVPPSADVEPATTSAPTRKRVVPRKRRRAGQRSPKKR